MTVAVAHGLHKLAPSNAHSRNEHSALCLLTTHVRIVSARLPMSERLNNCLPCAFSLCGGRVVLPLP